MRSFALAASGGDRPGIVAAVTGALVEHGVNIEDAEMANLRGHFTIVLILTAPDDVDEGALRAALDRVRIAVPLETLALSPVETFAGATPPASHALSVYGADHPGIVHAVTHALAERGVNIVGLRTRVVGDDQPLYVMLIEAAVPAELHGSVDGLLARVAQDLGVDVSVRALDADAL